MANYSAKELKQRAGGGIENRKTLDYCATGKPQYRKKAALTAKNKRWKTDRVKLREYHCPICNMWHLTSDIREKKRKRQPKTKDLRKKWHLDY